MGALDVEEVAGDGSHRVERVHPALQHECESVAALMAELLAGQIADVGAVEIDHAAVEVRRRLEHPRECIAKGRLAAPRLADEPDELALIQRQADVADRPDVLAARRSVGHVEVGGSQQRHHFSLSRGLDSASTPKLISVKDTANRAIARPGARTSTHCPVSMAFCCWAK